MSRSLSTMATFVVPGGADRLGQRAVVDALDRQLARRIERRDDDAVGVLEAGGELVEQVAHARVAMRLHHRDHAPARAGARRLQHGGDLDGMVAVVVVDGDAVPGAGELEAPLDAGEARRARLRITSSAMPASLAAAIAASALSALWCPAAERSSPSARARRPARARRGRRRTPCCRPRRAPT